MIWIPDSKTPNGVAEVPLTDLAVAAVRDQMQLAADSPYLFPSENAVGHQTTFKTVWRLTLRRAKSRIPASTTCARRSACAEARAIPGELWTVEHSPFNDPRLGLSLHTLTQPVTQVPFNPVALQGRQLVIAEHLVQVHDGTCVRLVRLRHAQRRPRVVLQEQVRPPLKREFLTLANDLEDIVVAGLKSFA